MPNTTESLQPGNLPPYVGDASLYMDGFSSGAVAGQRSNALTVAASLVRDVGASSDTAHLGGLDAGPHDTTTHQASTRDEIHAQANSTARLEGTVKHLRSWMAHMQARYHLYNPDASRPAKRIYIGDLTTGVSESALRQFINQILVDYGGCTGPGPPIVACKLYPAHGAAGGAVLRTTPRAERAYAFVEFRGVEEASNCMALDGVRYGGAHLKVRRPNNYDANLALMLGPTEPDPCMHLCGLDVVRTVVSDGPDKLFVGGLPCDWSEETVKDMLAAFGRLAAFNLVQDRVTGNSKGYAFCQYADPGITATAIAALNGKAVGSKFLTVKHALAGSHP